MCLFCSLLNIAAKLGNDYIFQWFIMIYLVIRYVPDQQPSASNMRLQKTTCPNIRMISVLFSRLLGSSVTNVIHIFLFSGLPYKNINIYLKGLELYRCPWKCFCYVKMQQNNEISLLFTLAMCCGNHSDKTKLADTNIV